ncbi:MAG: Veg family protein [Proteocatella sp.]
MDKTLTTEDIKKGIGKYVGKKIVVKANKGRKKIVTKTGMLEAIYPSIFIVKYGDEGDVISRVSYSYSDILTSNVQIKLVRD